MLQLINTKALYFIAALLVMLVGIETRRELREMEIAKVQAIEAQHKADAIQHDKERWAALKNYQKTEPLVMTGPDKAIREFKF